MVFKDRADAGRKLAAELSKYSDDDVILYALPRGGVEVAAEIVRYLNAPLELLIARKIGHPSWPEYAIGAVTETGDPVWNDQELLAVDEVWAEEAVASQRQEAKRHRLEYPGAGSLQKAKGKTAIIVDDGVATGLTMIAAIQELRQYEPERIVVAVPVASYEVAQEIANYADEVIVGYIPPGDFGAVGAYYRKFDQVEDDEVKSIMRRFSKTAPGQEGRG